MVTRTLRYSQIPVWGKLSAHISRIQTLVRRYRTLVKTLNSNLHQANRFFFSFFSVLCCFPFGRRGSWRCEAWRSAEPAGVSRLTRRSQLAVSLPLGITTDLGESMTWRRRTRGSLFFSPHSLFPAGLSLVLTVFFLLLIYFCFIFSSLSFHVSFLSFIFFDLKHHIFFLLRHFRFSALLIPLPLLPYCVILLLLFSLTLFSATHSLNLSYRVLYSRPLYSPFYCNCRYRVLSLAVVAKSSASGC